VAAGEPAFLLPADDVRHEDRRGLLHVLRAAAVEVAALLDEREGVEARRPVFLSCLDDVQMSDDQDRSALSPSRQTRHQVLLARRGSRHPDGRLRKARGPPPPPPAVPPPGSGGRRGVPAPRRPPPGTPAARGRAATASAAGVEPTPESVVLISTSSLKISRAS